MEKISLARAVDNLIDYRISSLYTAIPCRIVTIKNSLNDQRVDLQPLINKKLKDGTEREHPTILNVPVMFPASKTASVTFPIDVGDIVLCIFSQRSLDAFKASTGAETYTPTTNRKFDLTDAIAIPGLFPFQDSINDPAKRKWTHSTRDVVMVNNIGTDTECEFRLKDTGDIEVRTDQDFYAKFRDGLIECNNLTIDADGSIVVNAGNVINTTSTGNTTISSQANISLQATGDMAISAATWNVSISGTSTINAPVTNWTGVLNLAGSLAMSGGGGGGGSATIDVPLTINESVTVNGGDVSADGISLKNHVHSDPQGGTTGPAQ